MVLMPRWEEQADDRCIEAFARILLQTVDGMDGSTDLRDYSGAVSSALAAAHAAPRTEEEVIILSD